MCYPDVDKCLLTTPANFDFASDLPARDSTRSVPVISYGFKYLNLNNDTTAFSGFSWNWIFQKLSDACVYLSDWSFLPNLRDALSAGSLPREGVTRDCGFGVLRHNGHGDSSHDFRLFRRTIQVRSSGRCSYVLFYSIIPPELSTKLINTNYTLGRQSWPDRAIDA